MICKFKKYIVALSNKLDAEVWQAMGSNVRIVLLDCICNVYDSIKLNIAT
ncbi:hypothetical protein NIES4102_33270 [Chondrocystis sp. NIES-4102]|nr:hypothetical protein NIES4102_33270 [Chondrocystis sp. NIES-4102]